MSQPYTFNRDEITCPYCGNVHSDSWEVVFDSAECAEFDCEKCGEIMDVTRDVCVSYSTKVKS